ncbi:rust resistance kinase Lr10 [Citrus clementina]|uniref:rust resistance kinase Lr10 n=1 Tax=Citrus clementina TaxID=85681 RepID=UPI000CED7C96|nr:rust resistance kinase Lr10 [Citrus x clementina]
MKLRSKKKFYVDRLCRSAQSTSTGEAHRASFIDDSNGLGPLSVSLISTGTSIGGIVLSALVIFLIYKSRESEKEKETQLKVEKFLENYRTVDPTRYTYKELKKITSRFKHRLGQGGYGSVFRGKLFNGIPVAVRMLEHLKGNGQEFINEVATIGRIHHFHIVRLLGFCSEGNRRALIYEFMPNGSLEKFIFSKTNSSSHRQLSWEKLRKIAFGVARGVEYLHQGYFGLAKLCSKDISIVSLTAARGTAGYIAPELFSRNFGEVSYKSDVYSYGMMLLEMVGCRKNNDPAVEIQSQIYFPEWIYNRTRQGQELCLEFEEDGDEGIARKLAIVALWCIQWNPTERPSMPMVLQMLEADLQSLEIPPMPFVSSDVETGAIT